jgi:preprotein translocase subunit SecG
MQTVLLVIHLMLAVSLVGAVLLQKSEGGALGMGGGGMSGFMTGRSTANLLTRTTAIIAAAFFATSILLVILAAHRNEARSIIEQPAPASQTAPAQVPAAPQPTGSAPVAPAAPAEPSAPLAK